MFAKFVDVSAVFAYRRATCLSGLLTYFAQGEGSQRRHSLRTPLSFRTASEGFSLNCHLNPPAGSRDMLPMKREGPTEVRDNLCVPTRINYLFLTTAWPFSRSDRGASAAFLGSPVLQVWTLRDDESNARCLCNFFGQSFLIELRFCAAQ